MSLHTPGPWEFHEQGDANFYAITHFKERRKSVDWLLSLHWLLSLQHNGEQLDFEQKANMLLIAAAPDLLEALDKLLAATVDEDLKYGITLTEAEEEARALALAAIAKTVGEDDDQ